MIEVMLDVLINKSVPFVIAFVESLTGVRPTPLSHTEYGAVGFGEGVPDPDLSYSSTPIIAGGAFVIGNIFE